MLDSLRGLAALSVVLFHYYGFIPAMNIDVDSITSAIVAVTRYGHLGVEVFFVLSGFVIALTSARLGFDATTARRFFSRRMLRVLPPYWFMIGLIAVTLVLGKSLGYLSSVPLTPGQVMAHLFYMQEIFRFPPLDVAYWTLCLEVQFYAFYCLLQMAMHRLPTTAQVSVLGASALASLAIYHTKALPPGLFPVMWFQFAIGAIAFHATNSLNSKRLLAIAISLLLIYAYFEKSPACAATALCALFIVVFSQRAGTARWSTKPLAWLGGLSYSLYLCHGLVGLPLSIVLRRHEQRSQLFAGIAVLFAVVAALLFARLLCFPVERAAIRLSKRFSVRHAEP